MFKQLTTYLTSFCFLWMSLLTPIARASDKWVAPAPSSAGQSNWASHSADTKNWIDHTVSTKSGARTVKLPRDNYHLLSQAQWKPPARGANDVSLLEGPEWITRNMPGIGKAGGLKDGEFTGNYIAPQPVTGPMVFAAYSPENAKLRIWVQKVELLPNGQTVVMIKDFTPHHGRHWQVSHSFLTASELASDRNQVGINPFAAFAGAENDPLFHNISWAAAGVAVGQAVMREQALFGWIAVPKVRYDQQKKKSGNLFKKKVKITITSFIKPDWWFVAPRELLPAGQLAAICVGPEAIANPDAGCTDPGRVATSGLLLKPWTSSDLPSAEEMVYRYEKKQEGFTVFTFMLLAFMVTYAGVALMSGAGGMGVAGTAGQATGVSAMQAGAGAAIANLAGATIFGDGQLTSIQNGYLGAIKSGKISPTYNDGHSERTALGIYNRWILPAIDKGQAHDSIGTWFGLKCPLNLTVAQCQAQGYNPGMGWRTDSFGIEQTVKRMAENWKRCKAGGYTGEQLNKCAAPGGSNLLLNIRK